MNTSEKGYIRMLLRSKVLLQLSGDAELLRMLPSMAKALERGIRPVCASSIATLAHEHQAWYEVRQDS